MFGGTHQKSSSKSKFRLFFLQNHRKTHGKITLPITLALTFLVSFSVNKFAALTNYKLCLDVVFPFKSFRFFHLSDLFLRSPLLPEYLVAAFVKRLSRLALTAPANTLPMVLQFLGNLLIRHPGLQKMAGMGSAAACEM